MSLAQCRGLLPISVDGWRAAVEGTGAGSLDGLLGYLVWRYGLRRGGR